MSEESEQHQILGGKVYLYRRGDSLNWHCSTFLKGKLRRQSTKEESLGRAKQIAEDWYLDLRGKARVGSLETTSRKRDEKTFREVADTFLVEFEQLTAGQRSPLYIASIRNRLKSHLLPFLGSLGISQVTSAKIQDYRVHRTKQSTERLGHPPARNTIHQEIVTLRQVLKTARRRGLIDHLPDLSTPYGASGKVDHRGWFSADEYKKLYEATRERARHPPKPRFTWDYQQLHDYVLFMANTGLRPDEAKASRLQFRDVAIVDDERTGETILEIQVRGKRGVGFCKSMSGAVRPFERLRDRLRPPAVFDGRRRVTPGGRNDDPKAWKKPEPTDPIFPKFPKEIFRAILDETNLRFDREGHVRTAYSLRHTYVCLRLLEGADIYQIAKNCRTSVEMIQKFYAAHLKNQIDASAINVRRAKPAKKAKATSKPRRRRDEAGD